MDYTLSPYEWAIAKYIGRVRQHEAEASGLQDKHGLELGRKAPLECHIMGVAGEIACARILNVYWQPTVNTFKAPDLSEDLQIRTRGRHEYDLIVRPRDRDDELFVLVTTSGKPEDMLYRVHGYLRGSEAKQERYSRSYGGRAPAFFVPPRGLRPIERLIEKLITAQAVRIGIIRPRMAA